MRMNPLRGERLAETGKLQTPLRFGATIQQSALPDGGRVEVYDDIVVLSGARTPFARMGGSFKDVPAEELLRIAMAETLKRADVDSTEINEVIVGNIIANKEQQSFLPRQVATALQVPNSAIASAANRLCGTGFEVVRLAAHELANGGDSFILTGGVENMTRTPVLDNTVYTDRFKAAKLASQWGPFGKLAALVYDKTKTTFRRPHTLNPLELGLTDPQIGQVMFQTADTLSQHAGVSRQEAEAFAARSQHRAGEAQQNGVFDAELVSVKRADLQKGRLPNGVETVSRDEHLRPNTSAKKLAKLPVLDRKQPGAIHTAGTSSGIVDGASALLVSTGQLAQKEGLPVLSNVKAMAVTGCAPEVMGLGPVRAIDAALKASNLTLDDVDVLEVNEAFAGQVLGVAKELAKVQNTSYNSVLDKLNPEGGAIALGHPIAATGGRILLHAALKLKAENKRYAVVSACIGGGQGIAAVLENPDAGKPQIRST